MTSARLAYLVAGVLSVASTTPLLGACVYPAYIDASVATNLSTTRGAVDAPGGADVKNLAGEICTFMTVSATVTIKQNGVNIASDSGSGPGSVLVTASTSASIENCYSSSITASSGWLPSASGSGSQQCWYGPPPPPPGGGDDDGGESGGSGGGCIDPSSCSPLLLDLNGDGVHTTGAEAPVWFDLDGDGRNERIGWSHPATSEAFLWIDLKPNHIVDNGRELFGVGTILPNGQRARDGFEALTVHDQPANGGNGDGKITVADAIWGRLRLWLDENHNGVSQPTEIAPLQSAQVVELRLNAVTSSAYDAQGNLHGLQSTYLARAHERGERLLEDVFFRRFE